MISGDQRDHAGEDRCLRSPKVLTETFDDPVPVETVEYVKSMGEVE